jgi:hypothetical protein
MPEPPEPPTQPPLFHLPADANVPSEWIAEDNPAEMRIVVPSWGRGPKDKYQVLMLKETRQLFCECPGFRFRHKCHHLPYLIGFTTKPLHPHGIQDTTLDAFFKCYATLEAHEEIVLSLLHTRGPLTNREIAEELHWPVNCVTGRTNHLRHKEPPMVEDAGRKIDPITGRWAHIWRAIL